MIRYIDVERTVREVYRLELDPKYADTLTTAELLQMAVERGRLVSQVEYERGFVEAVTPYGHEADRFMQEREFWDVP